MVKRLKGTLLTPINLSETVKAGRRRFWKQVLPVTTIDYDGQKIAFDPAFHRDLQLAYKDKAFEQVPIVFAGQYNDHNMDPRNFGGDVIDMQYRGDGPEGGTWALIEADRVAAKAIRKNPKLGVSARIRQGISKSDGRKFKRAINHVLLTMNPRVSTEPWQAVDLSEATDTLVVDLTAVKFKEGKHMGKQKTKSTTVTVPVDDDGNIDLSEFSDEEFEGLLDLAAAVAEDERVKDLVDEDEDEDVEDEPPRKIKRKKSKTKVTVEKESEDDDPEDDEDEEDDEEDDDTDLSEIALFRKERAEEKWEAKRSKMAAAGVPPFMLDLAEPVLKTPGNLTLDLSDDETVDAKKVIEQMLEKSVGLIDLSDEEGSSLDLSDANAEKFEGQDLYDEWVKEGL